MVSIFGSNCVCLGSDYPFPLGEEHPGALAESLGLAPEALSDILSNAALRWLGDAATTHIRTGTSAS